MRTAAAAIILSGLMAVPLGAQGRSRAQRVPPGHMPPAGQCRVWYEGIPPGRQPAPTDCNTAERIASRDRAARVIYGPQGPVRGNRGWEETPRRPRAVPRPAQPPVRGGGYSYGYGNVAFDHGYRDGLEKGREDARDHDPFDPVRHRWYRSGDRGYDRRYGSKDDYRLIYRDGFEAGYNEGYRQNERRRGGFWPF